MSNTSKLDPTGDKHGHKAQDDYDKAAAEECIESRGLLDEQVARNDRSASPIFLLSGS